MSKETLWSHWWEWGKQPTLFYSTNEDIATTFSERKKRKEEKAAWKIREKELEADRIKSEESKEELEHKMIIRNSDDGLWKLKKELELLTREYLSSVPDHTETHAIWGWERSIEVYSLNNHFIEEFVWLNWTRFDEEPTDLWAKYDERYKEHEWEWKLLWEKIEKLRKRIIDIKQIQKWKLTASEISETLSWTKE